MQTIFIIFSAHPSTKSFRTFFKAWKGLTDYGACCLVSPYLNFVNEETKGLDPDKYEGRHWQYLSKGAQSDQFGGTSFLLDVESFDYSQTNEESAGFIIVLSDQQDKPMVEQDGYMISPGN